MVKHLEMNFKLKVHKHFKNRWLNGRSSDSRLQRSDIPILTTLNFHLQIECSWISQFHPRRVEWADAEMSTLLSQCMFFKPFLWNKILKLMLGRWPLRARIHIYKLQYWSGYSGTQCSQWDVSRNVLRQLARNLLKDRQDASFAFWSPVLPPGVMTDLEKSLWKMGRGQMLRMMKQ